MYIIIIILFLYAEILEALSSSSSMPIMTTIYTNTNATISQQITRSTIVHHTSVSSVETTTTPVSSTSQLSQGVLIYKSTVVLNSRDR